MAYQPLISQECQQRSGTMTAPSHTRTCPGLGLEAQTSLQGTRKLSYSRSRPTVSAMWVMSIVWTVQSLADLVFELRNASCSSVPARRMSTAQRRLGG